MIGMASDQAKPACPYCGESRLKLTHAGVFHRLKRDHGPFDFYLCLACGSGVTFPMPSAAALSALYSSYEAGLPREQRARMDAGIGEPWHKLCVKRIASIARIPAGASFNWVDIGAGNGEMANLMIRHFPNSRGLAIDLHDRPKTLESGIDWVQADLNVENFAQAIHWRAADLVYATAVWEHLVRPDAFIANVLRLLGPRGTLYLICPNYASLARAVLNTRWPYFSPGEHLTMPSPLGARVCLHRGWAQSQRPGTIAVVSHAICLPYSLSYTAARFGLNFLARSIPHQLEFPLPVGALETASRIEL